ncbi:MAG: ABC transporter ATP-binding protein, partial [Planctomycetota bacterium]
MDDKGPARHLKAVSRVLSRLLPYVRPYRSRLAIAALLTLLFIAVGIARPWPIKVVIDQVILGQDWRLLPEWLSGVEYATRLLIACCVAVLSLAALAGILGYWKTLLLASVGQRVVAKLREDLHDHLLGLSLAYHGDQRSGDLLVRMVGDTVMMRQLLVEGLFSLGQETLMVLGVLGVMAWLDPMLAVVAALVVPLIVTVMLVFGSRLRDAARKQRLKEGQIGTAIGESLTSIPVIQAYSLEEEAAKRFSRRNRKSLKAGLTASKLEGKMSGWTEISIAVGISVTLLIGVGKVRGGLLTAGELLVILSYVRALYKPLRKVVLRSSRLFKSAASGERVLEILDASLDLPRPERPIRLSSVRGEVSFSGVGFAYTEDRRVLDCVDLHLHPGEKLALLGSNGSGKTTLASLIPRLRDVDQGSVSIDGHDVRSLDLTSLRRSIAIVFQDT